MLNHNRKIESQCYKIGVKIPHDDSLRRIVEDPIGSPDASFLNPKMMTPSKQKYA